MTDGEFAAAAVGADGAITAWSQQAERLLGYAASDVVGRRATGLLTGQVPGLARGGAGARPWAGVVAARRRDGGRAAIYLRVQPMQDPAGRTGWLLLGHPADTGEAPGAAPDVRQLLDWAVTQSPVEILLFDPDLRQLRLSAAMCLKLRLPSESAALGRRVTDLKPGLVSAPDATSFEAQARRAMRTGEPAVWRGPKPEPGVRARHREVIAAPVRDPAGRVCAVLAVGLDGTQQRLARERLALVNEASIRIGSTLDVARTAQELVEVAVPQLADFATVDLLESVVHGDEPPSGRVSGTLPVRRVASASVLAGTPEAVVRTGQSYSYPENSPGAECLTSGRTVSRHEAEPETAPWAWSAPDLLSKARGFGLHSYLLVPIRARGATLGIAGFARHRRPEPFEDDDLVLAEEIVARAAVCIDNARRYTREHATALTLQRSLLPRRLPAQAAVEVATRYLPAGAGADVGGDWFDVIRLPGSRVALVVGDVVGHGLHAAATMGRLRTAVRTLADMDLEPGELLTRLDDVVTRISAEEGEPADPDGDLSATCLYAIYDPVTRCCTLARAGHPLPLLVTPGQAAQFLDLPAGPPLGVGGVPFEEARAELPEDSLLVLYTDGLVESRRRDIGAGLAALRTALTRLCAAPAPPDLESVCDKLIGDLLYTPGEDDAALLVARTRALPAGQTISWDLPAETAVVASARGRAGRQATAWGLADATFSTELIVSELVTNAIRHGTPPIRLRMILDDTLTCEVSDGSSTAPHPRRPDSTDEGGRGLLLIAQLTERWGTRHTATGKTIWAQQTLTARPGERPARDRAAPPALV